MFFSRHFKIKLLISVEKKKKHLIVEISELPAQPQQEDKEYILSMSISMWEEGVKQMEPSSTQWCQEIGLEARAGTDAQEVPPEKNFLSMQVTEPWNRLPRDAVDSSSLEIVKNCLETTCARCSRKTLLKQAGGTRWPHQWSHPTAAILCKIQWHHHLPSLGRLLLWELKFLFLQRGKETNKQTNSMTPHHQKPENKHWH